jgi:DNA-binding response OmpR family regulator
VTRAVSMTWPQYRRHECTIDGVTVRLRPQQAELLSVLLVGSPVGFLHADALIEGVWPDPDREPDTAENCIAVYIGQLRRLGVTIEARFHCGRSVRQHNGYRIPVTARAADAAQRLAA